MSISEKKIRKMILPDLKASLFAFQIALEDSQLTSYIKDNGSSDLSNGSTNYNSQEISNFRNNFYFFRNLISNIYLTSKFSSSDPTEHKNIIRVIDKFEENKIYSAGWINNKEISEALNADDKISQDPENINYIHQTLQRNKLNISSEIKSILLGYTKYKISELFKLNSYMSRNLEFDIAADHPLHKESLILFEIKLNQENIYTAQRDHIFQLHENLKNIDETTKTTNSQIVLISFSQIAVEQFESVKFKFNQLAKQLGLDSQVIQRIHLIPATAVTPITMEKELKKIYEELLSQTFTHEFKSEEEIKNNHNILPSFFDTNSKEINITIIPKKTIYWRFGFVLSNDKEFSIDKTTENRHFNQDTQDIHICVGDMLENREWKNSNHLSLAFYKIDIIGEIFPSYLHYNQEQVEMKIQLFDEKIKVSIFIANKLLGERYFINTKKYIHFMAWGDFRPYLLTANFEIKQLELKKINIIFKGDQPSNIGSNQLFNDQNHLDNWITDILNSKLLKEIKIHESTLEFTNFDGYKGFADLKFVPDNFKNY